MINWFRSHRYCLVLLYIPLYLSYFTFLEIFPPEKFHIISCPLDYLIPTIPAFFPAYALWWGLFPGALLYFLFKGTKENFLKLCFIIFTGYTICLLVYTFFPNGLSLREPLYGNDLFTKALLWLRSIDPPQHVCPSMHVSSTVAIDICVQEDKLIRSLSKKLIRLSSILIILSTLFLKQHSIIDAVLGMLLSIMLRQVYKLLS